MLSPCPGAWPRIPGDPPPGLWALPASPGVHPVSPQPAPRSQGSEARGAGGCPHPMWSLNRLGAQARHPTPGLSAAGLWSADVCPGQFRPQVAGRRVLTFVKKEPSVRKQSLDEVAC